MTKIVFMVLILMFHGFAFGYDGNKMLQECNDAVRIVDSASEGNFAAANYCLGYLGGIADMVVAVPVKNICIPREGLEASQCARIVVKFLKEHPKRLHEGATNLVLEAYRAAFPCKKK